MMQLTLQIFVTGGAIKDATPHRNNYNEIRNCSHPDCIVPKNEEIWSTACGACRTAVWRAIAGASSV